MASSPCWVTVTAVLLALCLLDFQCRASGRNGNGVDIYAATRGESGPLCTEKGQHCLNNTRCRSRGCVCPNGQKGSALIHCVKDDQVLCQATLDPEVIAFGGASSRMTLPCRHRLSRFVTKNLAAGKNKHSFCTFEVFALTQISWEGVFYQQGVDVDIGLVDLTHQQSISVDLKKLGIGYKGLYTYSGRGEVAITEWGNSVHEEFNGITIYCNFDHVENFAEIVVPECDTVIRFRPYNISADGEVQKQKPGVTVQAPGNATFDPQFGGFPASLCGLPQNTDELYKKLLKKRRFLKKTAAALTFEMLTVAVSQTYEFFELQYASECEEASQLVATCWHREGAVDYCNNVLYHRPTLRCLIQNYISPMKTFNNCLKFFCYWNEEAYQQFRDDITKCLDEAADILKDAEMPDPLAMETDD